MQPRCKIRPKHRPTAAPGAVAVAAAAAAALGAAIVGACPRRAAAEERGMGFEAFATVSPLASFGLPADGRGPDAKGVVALGVGGAVSRRLGRSFELGLGGRYDYGRGDGDSMHALAAPLTATLVIPVGAGRELRTGVGLGLGLAFLPGYGPGDSALRVLGVSSELALGFAQRVRSDGLGLSLQLGVRFDLLSETNADPDDGLNGGQLFHVQAPFVRAGATWR
jgi:hypothetical protein